MPKRGAENAMRFRVFALTLWLLLTGVAVAVGAPAVPSAEKIPVGDAVRTYSLYIPSGMERQKPAPLLFVLHGSGGSGEDMRTLTQRGFERLADRDKFVVVYPDALERRWNEQDGNIDDAGFLLAVADQLAARGVADAKRVYFAGISNGGMMAERMACEYSDRVAAIAVVAGSMTEKMAAACKPSRAMPVLLIHGTEDLIIPWSGGAVAGFEDFGKVLSAKAAARFWATQNLCGETPRVSAEPDLDPTDGIRVYAERFIDCKKKSEVDLFVIEGGGHTWPGGYQYLPERFIGKTSKDMDANKIIWEFFQRWRE